MPLVINNLDSDAQFGQVGARPLASNDLLNQFA